MSRELLRPFEEYQKARINFVQTIADLASKSQNIEALNAAGVMALLRPLLLDTVPSIQQSAALAIGRLANYSEELATSVVENNIIPQLIFSLSKPNKFFKKVTCYVLSKKEFQVILKDNTTREIVDYVKNVIDNRKKEMESMILTIKSQNKE
jgi:hypothetical protein